MAIKNTNLNTKLTNQYESNIFLKDFQQELIPHINRPGQAPMQAVTGILGHPMPARMRVRPHHHRERHIHQLYPPPFPLGPPHLLHLNPPKLPRLVICPQLTFAQRPRPVAVPAAQPRAVLKMRHGVGPHDCQKTVALLASVYVIESGSEDHSDGGCDADARDLLLVAVDAADELALLMDEGASGEPVAVVDYCVVELRELVCPHWIHPVEVDVEGVGGGSVGDDLVGLDQELRPNDHEGEVVGGEVPGSVLVLRVLVGVDWSLGLQLKLMYVIVSTL